MKTLLNFFNKHLSNQVLWLSIIIACYLDIKCSFIKMNAKTTEIKNIIFYVALVGFIYNCILYVYKIIIIPLIQKVKNSISSRKYLKVQYNYFINFIENFSKDDIEFLLGLLDSGKIVNNDKYCILITKLNQQKIDYICKNLLIKRNNLIFLVDNYYFHTFLPNNFEKYGNNLKLNFGINFFYFLIKYYNKNYKGKL